ncbi:alpha/beta hydrolase [Chryseobacterium fluminis]|uniref:alpha/beta hydrolase n=1 Tax=Chryseobacterium fluminis TaxID=2983606 RepID=UPI002259571E|nr:alpha/beta hydrolase [Chryseobacterium sp. MMS21-Ot14]UZT97935.1 alpha/beta hydrolase [Chryseobacterium sp. MMS21-Ot14]
MKNKIFTWSIAMCALTITASCNNKNESKQTSDSSGADSSKVSFVKPVGTAPNWGKTMTPEMLAVIEKLSSYGDKPIENLTPAEARKNHTPTDAVMDIVKENKINMPAPKVDTTGTNINVAGGKIHLRIYTPKTGNGPFPVIVYYHGGGFVIADLDVYNASAQGLSEKTGAIVVSVAYRLAPENKFPTAHNDAFAAYQWVLNNIAGKKGNPKKIAVVGESAGGNLAANVSIMARDRKIIVPLHQILVYPIAQSDMSTKSYQQYAASKPLNKPMMEWFTKHYLNNMDEAKDPRISLINANLKGLPATTIITAEIDPLNEDGKMLAAKLSAAGVKVESKNYAGVTHEFFGMAIIVPEAMDAQFFAADKLRSAFK